MQPSLREQLTREISHLPDHRLPDVLAALRVMLSEPTLVTETEPSMPRHRPSSRLANRGARLIGDADDTEPVISSDAWNVLVNDDQDLFA